MRGLRFMDEFCADFSARRYTLIERCQPRPVQSSYNAVEQFTDQLMEKTSRTKGRQSLCLKMERNLEILKRGADAAFKTALVVSYRRKDNASSRKQTTIDMW